MSSPVTEPRKSTLTLTREQLLTKFGESKHTIIDTVLNARDHGKAIDVPEYQNIEKLVRKAIRFGRKKEENSPKAVSVTEASDVSSRNDPRLKPVKELPRQRPFHLQKEQAAKAGVGCKANGQYDLIIEYDSYMHALEEKERSHREKQMKKDYKKELDSQMAAKRAALVDRARVHEGDRLAMLEAGENLKRENDEEARKKKMTRLVMMQDAEDAQRMIRRRLQREMAERDAERKESLQKIQRVAIEEAIERRRRAAAYEKRRNEIRRNIEDAIATRRRAREEDSKQAAIVTKQQIAAAEANEKAKEEFRAHLADRLEKVARSIGKDLSENAKRREEEENRRLEAQLQAAEIAYRKAEANKRVRQEETRREILEGLSQQIRQKAKVKEVEEAVNKRQGEENHKVAIEALKDEEEEKRRMRQKRVAMDEELEKQIWFTKLTTEEDRMEMDLQRRELELNQPLFREMAAHGYKEEKCRELLLSPQVDLTHE